jgi:hypothetical protein
MWDRVGEYGLEGNILSYGVTRGIGEFLVWTKYCKNFKVLSIYL